MLQAERWFIATKRKDNGMGKVVSRGNLKLHR
jgi:hypothetical protein